MKKIIISFRTKSDAKFLAFAQHVLLQMTDNANFPNPDPALSILEAAVLAFSGSLAAMAGNHQSTEVKNQCRKALEKVLRSLGNYVNDHSNGNAAIKISSGFELSKDGGPVGPLGKVTGFKVEAGHKKAKLSCDADEHAHSYSWEVTAAPATDESVWTIGHSTAAQYTFTKLTSGKQYAFRVAAIGTDPELNYSDVIESYVL